MSHVQCPSPCLRSHWHFWEGNWWPGYCICSDACSFIKSASEKANGLSTVLWLVYWNFDSCFQGKWLISDWFINQCTPEIYIPAISSATCHRMLHTHTITLLDMYTPPIIAASSPLSLAFVLFALCRRVPCLLAVWMLLVVLTSSLPHSTRNVVLLDSQPIGHGALSVWLSWIEESN